MNNNRMAMKAGVWYTVCNFLSRAASFITTPIFTRVLTKSEVGLFANFNSWIGILVIITTFDLYASISVARFDYKDKLDEYIGSIICLGSTITIVVFSIMLLFHNFFCAVFDMEPWMLALAGVYCMVFPATQMFQLKSQIQYKYRISVLVTMVSLLSSVLISLLMVLVMKEKIVGRIIGYYFPLVAINIVLYVYILKCAKSISAKYWRYAIAIAFPLIWHTLASNLLSSSDRIMITQYCGTSDTALYSVVYASASVMSILWNSMNTAWSPWAYERMDAKAYDDLKKASKPYIIFFLYVTIIFLLLGPELILVMGGETYMDAIKVLPPVVIGFVFQFVYSLYVNIEFYYKKQKIIAMATIIAAVVNLGLNALFIPRFGYMAAAYTTLVGYVVLYTIHFLNVRRMGKCYWYDTKFNIMSVLGAMIILALSIVVYDNRVLRLIILGVLSIASIVIAIIKKDYFIKIIKKII